MRKYFREVLLFLFTAAVLLAPVSTSAADARPGVPLVDDDQEYQVFAFLLYTPVTSPSARPREDGLRYSMQPRYPIPGVRAGYHMVRDMTVRAEKQPSYGPDTEVIDDFNEKNVERARLSKDRLLAALPAGNPITIVTEEEFREGVVESRGAEPESSYPFATGTVGFSRVGFNIDRTKALVVIEWVSRRDHGRYRVRLYRSPESGQWEIYYVWK
jgi:hypothetical protein